MSISGYSFLRNLSNVLYFEMAANFENSVILSTFTESNLSHYKLSIMKRFLLLSILFLALTSLYSQVVITEIMYNPPESGNDSTEYIEIFNAGSEDISLLNYSFSAGIEMQFGD